MSIGAPVRIVICSKIMLRLAAILVALTTSMSAETTEPFAAERLTAPDGALRDYFGSSVAISGDTLVVGAPDATIGSHPYQGAAYVFTRSARGWGLAAKLTAAGGAFAFGYSVAIEGETIVVGAIEATVGSNVNQGAVYVFVRPSSGWATTSRPDARLTASDGHPNDLFGISVAISADTIVVGPRNQTSSTDVIQGAVYVFVKPPGGWETTSAFAAKLTSADGGTFAFGSAVGVSGDVVVVGDSEAYIGSNASQGAVYVFAKPAAGWATTSASDAKLTVSNGMTGTGLGASVAISGDTIVARAGGAVAYVFLKPSTGWRSTSAFDAELSVPALYLGEYGYSMAFSGEAVVLGTVGAYGGMVTERGAAYVFFKPANGWETTSVYGARMAMCGGAEHEIFGLSVAISGDALVVGAPYEPPLPGQPSAFPGIVPLKEAESNAGQDAAFVFSGDSSAVPPTRTPCVQSLTPVAPAPINGRRP